LTGDRQRRHDPPTEEAPLDAQSAAIAVLAVTILVLAVFFITWQIRRSRELVEGWAAANGYSIDSIERRYLWAGPFFWRRGRGHEVFHVVVRSPGGASRGAYVRTGGWILGQFSEQVVVRWDDDQA
jgi:hypothetical protein